MTVMQPHSESSFTKANAAEAASLTSRREAGVCAQNSINEALWLAALDNNPSKVEKMLSAGADVEYRYGLGMAPVLHCARGGAVLDLLLQAGADVRSTDEHGFTALHGMECSRWKRKVNPEVTKHLIVAGADVHARSKDGSTPLLTADRMEKVKLLLAAGADVNARNDSGRSAIFGALSLTSLQYLLDVGAEVNVQAKDGDTPLHHYSADWRASLLLLSHGARVNVLFQREDVRDAWDAYHLRRGGGEGVLKAAGMQYEADEWRRLKIVKYGLPAGSSPAKSRHGAAFA